MSAPGTFTRLLAPGFIAAALLLAPVGVPLASMASAAQETSTTSDATATPAVTLDPSATPAATTAAVTKLNLNTASTDELLTIPGVGDRMVREFLEYRPYTSITQFRREIGKYVSADQVAAYEQYVFVPVDPNQADAATLQQLPGVNAALADALIAARPYASPEAFLSTLGQYLPADQVAVAQAYLASDQTAGATGSGS